MKYILRTLWVIGLIPVWLLAMSVAFVYMLVVFPIAAAFIFIKTGNVEDDDLPMPFAPTEWLVNKYNDLLDKIK